MSGAKPITDVAPRFAPLLELVDLHADGEDFFLLRPVPPSDVAELLPLLDGQGGFRAGKPFVQAEVSDGQTELIVFIAPEVGIELSDVFDLFVALHVDFRRAKCTLRLGEYFFTLDIRHPSQSDKERIAAIIDYRVYHRFQFIRVKIYVGHWYHPFSTLQTCDPSAARGAWRGWGFLNSSLWPEERSDDCTPQAGVTVGHPDAQRRE